MLHAREKGRKLSEGCAYLSCHYVIALQIRNRPSSKRAALFRRTNHQGEGEEGCTSHYIPEDAALWSRCCPPSLLARTPSQGVSLFSLLLSPPLFLSCLLTVSALLSSFFSFSFLLSSSYRARHFVWSAFWLVGLTGRTAAGCSYWLAGWLTCITGGRQTWCLLFFTRLLLAEMLLAVLVVPAAPRLAPSHSLARTYAR